MTGVLIAGARLVIGFRYISPNQQQSKKAKAKPRCVMGVGRHE